MINHALQLAARGFYVFPVKAGSKEPPLVKFKEAATRDPRIIRTFWATYPTANVGIYTGRFGDDQALLVLDVDNKGDKRGDETLFQLDYEHGLPNTYEQQTPSGGKHLVYVVDRAVKQGVNVLGDGCDVRSRGGYIVGAGSSVKAGVYTGSDTAPVPAPGWLVDRLAQGAREERPEVDSGTRHDVTGIDADAASRRVVHYLENEAPLAVQGDGGDATTFKVACRVRDFGVDKDDAISLLLQHWNGRCSPPWNIDDLHLKIKNAYAYAQDKPGNSAPEAVFKPIEQTAEAQAEHPFAKLNSEYAIVISGGGYHIVWETEDIIGNPCIEHLSPSAFHVQHADQMMQVGKRTEPVTELWMKSPERRIYKRGLCFAPAGVEDPRFYNLWRGFAVQPAATSNHRAVKQWLEHLHENVCQGDAALAHWLTGYFAHMAQKPAEKPLVSLVFKGGKGVGKNALVGAVGNLLGTHYMVAGDRRYLVGNFNGHLESLLLFVLDEAVWAGDKAAEGVLKNLITGSKHLIEQKGKEPYTVDNLTRIIIIGNEEWLVPASHDERRFAVFNVGDGRKQDKVYFKRMHDDMVAGGGAAALLRFLLDFDLASVDVNAAPSSAGLLDQKVASLPPFARWWFTCLQEGGILGGEYSNTWPEKVPSERFQAAYRSWLRDKNISIRLPTQPLRELQDFAPESAHANIREGSKTIRAYKLPSLDACRVMWAQYLGQTVTWE